MNVRQKAASEGDYHNHAEGGVKLRRRGGKPRRRFWLLCLQLHGRMATLITPSRRLPKS
jgi:hypothetical protein